MIGTYDKMNAHDVIKIHSAVRHDGTNGVNNLIKCGLPDLASFHTICTGAFTPNLPAQPVSTASDSLL